MKIATWNVERLKHYSRLSEIQDACRRVNADIFVLTETDCRLRLNLPYVFETPRLPGGAALYAATENRVSIYSRYPILCCHKTFDENTAVCVELKTDVGSLFVYGTIIGVYGNRHPSFLPDLKKQMHDIAALADTGANVCVCGDFNLSLSDGYYFTAAGRNALLAQFSASGISVLTQAQPECIDHIAISTRLVEKHAVLVEEWNQDKRLSDHKGVSVALTTEEGGA